MSFSYLKDNQRAVPQVVPELPIPLLHVPIRVRCGPELRHPTFPTLPTQGSVLRYRQTEGSVDEVVGPSRNHGLEMLLGFFAWSRAEEGWIKEGREGGDEIWRCDV